jgi:hypothetical protein
MIASSKMFRNYTNSHETLFYIFLKDNKKRTPSFFKSSQDFEITEKYLRI